MGRNAYDLDSELLYCICPYCKEVRQKIGKKYTIIRRGRERNGLARFKCLQCDRWFNEKTGESMKWLER